MRLDQLVLTGPDADKPATGARVPGRLYFAVDDDGGGGIIYAVYRDNGTSWEPVGGCCGTAGGGGSGDLDGGAPDSIYGGTDPTDGGPP